MPPPAQPAAGYPPQQQGYPPQQGYPQQPGYPPQQAYPPQGPDLAKPAPAPALKAPPVAAIRLKEKK